MKQTKPKASKYINIRVTPDEKRLIKICAKAEKLTVTKWIKKEAGL